MRRGIVGQSIGPDGALIDPRCQDHDLLRRQRRMIDGHALLVALAEDAGDELTVAALAGDEGFAGVAALEEHALGVETQAAAALGDAVTFVAGLLEDRLHVARELDLSVARERD